MANGWQEEPDYIKRFRQGTQNQLNNLTQNVIKGPNWNPLDSSGTDLESGSLDLPERQTIGSSNNTPDPLNWNYDEGRFNPSGSQEPSIYEPNYNSNVTGGTYEGSTREIMQQVTRDKIARNVEAGKYKKEGLFAKTRGAIEKWADERSGGDWELTGGSVGGRRDLQQKINKQLGKKEQAHLFQGVQGLADTIRQEQRDDATLEGRRAERMQQRGLDALGGFIQTPKFFPAPAQDALAGYGGGAGDNTFQKFPDAGPGDVSGVGPVPMGGDVLDRLKQFSAGQAQTMEYKFPPEVQKMIKEAEEQGHSKIEIMQALTGGSMNYAPTQQNNQESFQTRLDQFTGQGNDVRKDQQIKDMAKSQTPFTGRFQADSADGTKFTAYSDNKNMFYQNNESPILSNGNGESIGYSSGPGKFHFQEPDEQQLLSMGMSQDDFYKPNGNIYNKDMNNNQSALYRYGGMQDVPMVGQKSGPYADQGQSVAQTHQGADPTKGYGATIDWKDPGEYDKWMDQQKQHSAGYVPTRGIQHPPKPGAKITKSLMEQKNQEMSIDRKGLNDLNPGGKDWFEWELENDPAMWVNAEGIQGMGSHEATVKGYEQFTGKKAPWGYDSLNKYGYRKHGIGRYRRADGSIYDGRKSKRGKGRKYNNLEEYLKMQGVGYR